MWTLKRNHNEFISINFMPDHLTLCFIKKINTQQAHHLFELAALTTIRFLHGEYDQGRVYNPTAIATHICTFLIANHAKKFPIAITLTGTHIKEQIISCPTALFSENLTPPKGQYIDNSCYLYLQEKGNFTYYRCAIERSIIMQYQLMAITKNFNIQSITTSSMAHLNLYRYLEGSSFSHNRLANLLHNKSDTIPPLVQDYTIAKVLHINPSIKLSDHQKDEIQTALGAIIRNI